MPTTTESGATPPPPTPPVSASPEPTPSRPRTIPSPPRFIMPTPPSPPTPDTEPTTPRPGEASPASAVKAGPPPLSEPIESFPGSTDSDRERPKSSIAGKAQCRRLARKAFAAITVALNEALATSQAERQEGVWIADKEDETDVGDPAGDILARHAPDMDGDIVDGVLALIGLAGYIAKSLARRRELRRNQPTSFTIDQEG